MIVDGSHHCYMFQAVVYASEACTLTETMWISTERRKLREFAEREGLLHMAGTTGIRDEKTPKMSESEDQPRSNSKRCAPQHARHEHDCSRSEVHCQETRTETAASTSHKNSDGSPGSSPSVASKVVGLTSKAPASTFIADSCQGIVGTDNTRIPKLLVDNSCPHLGDTYCTGDRSSAGELAERANIAWAAVDPAPPSDPEITRPER